MELSKKLAKEPNFVQAILNESKKVVKYRMGVLIVEHQLGFIHANAGIDRSNIDQEKDIVLLLLIIFDPEGNSLNLYVTPSMTKV